MPVNAVLQIFNNYPSMVSFYETPIPLEVIESVIKLPQKKYPLPSEFPITSLGSLHQASGP